MYLELQIYGIQNLELFYSSAEWQFLGPWHLGTMLHMGKKGPAQNNENCKILHKDIKFGEINVSGPRRWYKSLEPPLDTAVFISLKSLIGISYLSIFGSLVARWWN